MIGPVSGTGRAMMSSLQQAIAKGMPPEQAVQYVKSMATQGVAPLADLYAMMNQFQRLKQQQVQPPQTPPTIKDQLNMIDQQQQMQQRGGRGGSLGYGGPTSYNPEMQDPMSRGLGGIDAGLMEYPQFASGGIVAFQGGGFGEEIDFTKMSTEQLRTLANDENRDIAKAAYDEFLRRTGYVAPQEYLSRYAELVKQGIPTGGAFKFDSRKFPAYMYDEQGKVRRSDASLAGIGGLKEVPSSGVMVRRLSPDTPERFAQASSAIAERINASPAQAAEAQSAVPPMGATSPYSSSAAAGSAFDTAIGRARQDVRQDVPRAPALTTGRQGAASAGGATDPFAKLITEQRGRKFESIPDTFSGEEKKRIEKAISGLDKDKQDSLRMALAKAGFEWAAASARAGRQRTTGLGALAEGAIGGLQQYNATQKELKQTERELNKEMASLRRYQDEVARGERVAQRAFEEKRADNISDLTARSEQLKLNRAELAQKMQIAGMELEERRLERGERGAERKEERGLRERGLNVEVYKAALDDAADELKVARTIGTPEEIAIAEARVTEARANLMSAGGARVPAAIAPQSPIPSNILGIVNKYVR